MIFYLQDKIETMKLMKESELEAVAGEKTIKINNFPDNVESKSDFYLFHSDEVYFFLYIRSRGHDNPEY